MCDRFSQHYTWQQIHAFSEPLTLAEGRGNLQPRYNIAPTTSIDIIVAAGETRRLGHVRWWLVPGWWSKPLKDLPSTFNARVETVDSGAMFRNAFRSRRCIVPASGFFEWTGGKGEKTRHYISEAGGNLLAFAGLWDRWKSPEGEEIVSATIITRPADDFMAKMHTRMPSMLQPARMRARTS
jgi:putative SOS response-associated peptidase YedK